MHWLISVMLFTEVIGDCETAVERAGVLFIYLFILRVVWELEVGI